MVIDVKNVWTIAQDVRLLHVVLNAELVIFRILKEVAEHVQKIALKACVM